MYLNKLVKSKVSAYRYVYTAGETTVMGQYKDNIKSSEKRDYEWRVS